MATFREVVVSEKNFTVRAGDQLSLTPKQVSLRGECLTVIEPAKTPGGSVHVKVKSDVTFDKGEKIGVFIPPPPKPSKAVPAIAPTGPSSLPVRPAAKPVTKKTSAAE